MTDSIDAARWRKIAQYLRLEVTREENWETVRQSTKTRYEERITEWQWQLEVHPDHSWNLYGSTKDESQVPRSLDEFVDRLPSPSDTEEKS